jgi:hypothetical protein
MKKKIIYFYCSQQKLNLNSINIFGFKNAVITKINKLHIKKKKIKINNTILTLCSERKLKKKKINKRKNKKLYCIT